MQSSTVSSVCERLQNSPKLRALTQLEIARGAKIHQSQVSRILSGQFRRVTAKSVLRICEFASIGQPDQKPLSLSLEQTLRAVWGGTRSQEKALVQLLQAADALAAARAGDVNKRRRK
jgi:transcriptional regulator with XRE-family HTH domain